jgi:hypothetical protein
MVENWYERVKDDGLLDTLAPYQPTVVGAYPLGVAADDTPVEIVCRAVDLPAFARMMERGYGDRPDFALHGGQLDGEDAVFAEFDLGGVPLEVSAQAEHVNRRLGAATLGLDQVLGQTGDMSRYRLAAAVARGEDWLEAGLDQLHLSRAAIESLAGADPSLVRRVMGLPQPRIPVSHYLVPIAISFAADVMIVAAGAARGSQQYTGVMLLAEAIILGALFGARMGLVAALLPLVPVGMWLIGPLLVGQGSCGPDCGQTIAGYVYLPILIASCAGVAGLLRDRYRPLPS